MVTRLLTARIHVRLTNFVDDCGIYVIIQNMNEIAFAKKLPSRKREILHTMVVGEDKRWFINRARDTGLTQAALFCAMRAAYESASRRPESQPN